MSMPKNLKLPHSLKGTPWCVQVPSMVSGGTLWFTDLTSADPYYGLPILTGAFMLAMVQLNAAEGMQGQPPAMVKNFKIAMSVLAVVIVPFSYLLPQVGLGHTKPLLSSILGLVGWAIPGSILVLSPSPLSTPKFCRAWPHAP